MEANFFSKSAESEDEVNPPTSLHLFILPHHHLFSSPAVMAWTGGGGDVTADGVEDTGTAKETRDEEDDLSIV